MVSIRMGLIFNTQMDSLRNRIARQGDPDDGGFRLNDMGVLMNYASTNQNASPLNDEAYLRYGIPRVRGEGAEVIKARQRN